MATSMSSSESTINVWPVLIDLITSVLMIFVLVGFVQATLNVDDLEAMDLRDQQRRFVDQFALEFEDELEQGVLHIESRLDFLQLSFSDRVLFHSGDHRLGPGGRRLLARCAETLARSRQGGFEQIQVEGHTDGRPLDRPTYPHDNWELSTARALSVVRFLSASGDLSEALFSANGYGSNRPVASNDTAAGRAENRRIEMRIFFIPRIAVGQDRKP